MLKLVSSTPRRTPGTRTKKKRKALAWLSPLSCPRLRRRRFCFPPLAPSKRPCRTCQARRQTSFLPPLVRPWYFPALFASPKCFHEKQAREKESLGREGTRAQGERYRFLSCAHLGVCLLVSCVRIAVIPFLEIQTSGRWDLRLQLAYQMRKLWSWFSKYGFRFYLLFELKNSPKVKKMYKMRFRRDGNRLGINRGKTGCNRLTENREPYLSRFQFSVIFLVIFENKMQSVILGNSMLILNTLNILMTTPSWVIHTTLQKGDSPLASLSWHFCQFTFNSSGFSLVFSFYLLLYLWPLHHRSIFRPNNRLSFVRLTG